MFNSLAKYGSISRHQFISNSHLLINVWIYYIYFVNSVSPCYEWQDWSQCCWITCWSFYLWFKVTSKWIITDLINIGIRLKLVIKHLFMHLKQTILLFKWEYIFNLLGNDFSILCNVVFQPTYNPHIYDLFQSTQIIVIKLFLFLSI